MRHAINQSKHRETFVSTALPPQTLHSQVVTAGREAVSRAVRQTIQALIPTLLVIAGGSTVGLDISAIATLAGITALVSLLKSAATLKAGPNAPAWVQLGDRAVTAAAGTALGLVTVDGVIPSAEIHWQATLTASLGAAALALAMFYTNPPVAAAPKPEDDYLFPAAP